MSLQRHFSFTKPEDKAWYFGDFFEDAHLVTDNNYNPAFGIESIAILEPNTKDDNNIVANVQVVTTACTFSGTIFLAKNGRDLTFSPQTRAVEDKSMPNGIRQIPMVNVKQAVVAQILRLAETKHRLAEPVAWTGASPSDNMDITKMSAEQLLALANAKQAETEKVEVKEEPKIDLTQLSPEQLAMLTQQVQAGQGTGSDIKLPPTFQTK